jgi:F-type H+-transporting ATPase subunit gamma
MDTLQDLTRQLNGANDLKGVVKTMKVMAASNIGQYESAVKSLEDYNRTILFGIKAYLTREPLEISGIEDALPGKPKNIYAIVFGSDQGLVGQFNNTLKDFVCENLDKMDGNKEVWSVGERIQLLLSDTELNSTEYFPVPNSIKAVTSLTGNILIKILNQNSPKKGVNFLNTNNDEFYVIHNQPDSTGSYSPVMKQLLPLDEKWKKSITDLKWPTNNIPQILGQEKATIVSLIGEFLFMTLFKACTESLVSENTSRLIAMRRAEKNIDELVDELNLNYNSLRQSLIDSELFDIISGFEVLKRK